MKIVIEHRGVKRIIEGPFRVCIDKASARALREQLAQATDDEWCYGWIEIRTHEDVPGRPNTQPLAWDAPGRVVDA